MPKQLAQVEVSNFVGGLITDASPLTFPDNASLNEDNCVLNDDGSRNRRLGMDFEDDAVEITTTVSHSLSAVPAHSSYRWKNAGGDVAKNLLVVQFGNELKFFDLDNDVLSSTVLLTHKFTTSDPTIMYSYAVVDGLLVVANGDKDINIFEYDGSSTITHSTDTLLIRDFFGVAVTIDSDNLKTGNNVTIRPATKNDDHIYNLRNQTWAVPRKPSNGETLLDPIKHYFDTDAKYPANSDNLTQSLFPDANDTDDRIGYRFFAKDLQANPLGTSHAPIGHYIIDALERGTSRLEAIQKTEDEAPASANMITVTTLPEDKTPGGASVVSQYAGRVWYTGFQGDITNGDDKSPRMSSYILFSQVVNDSTDIGRCYQQGDPTSQEEPDLRDTDGGFIRIDDAYGIKALIPIDDSLFVLASNGIWRIVGDDVSTFKATGYSAPKVSDRGIQGPKSVVEIESSLLYWGDDGIYLISKNQFGDWVSQNVTENRIQTLYNLIGTTDKEQVQGYYDSYEKKARWVYGNDLIATTNVRELVFDKTLGAFYTNTIFPLDEGDQYPKVVGIYETNPFSVTTEEEPVRVGLDLVQASTVDVIVNSEVRSSTTRQLAYVTVTATSPAITYKFSNYKDTSFHDFKSVDDVGTDAAAFMITGYLSGGTFQRKKQVTYLTTFMKKSEDGFDIEVGGDLTPSNPSSCLVQFQWDWTDSENSNRWGTPREYYRHRRLYFPVDASDTYDDGHTVVASRDKVRGSGRVLSIKFSTSENKDFHLHGWSMKVGVLGDV